MNSLLDQSVIKVVFALALAIHCCLSAPTKDLITTLPGLNEKLDFKQYSGYITVGPGRALFYWFVESSGSPSKDPVVIWLQGGPGCSSLFGFFTEHGPFIINEDFSLSRNPYSWNAQANMLYVEAPAGVGFSYYNNSADMNTGDNQTMTDNLAFVRNWMLAFPEYSRNTLYISGESYGGHYVPQLAYSILNSNKAGNPKLNLAGIFVGNPWSDDVIDSNSVPYFIFFHHLCSLSTWNAVLSACDLNSERTLLSTKGIHRDYERKKLVGLTDECNTALENMMDEVGDDINQYNIYAPCVSGSGLDCSNYTLPTLYLNRTDVQVAIHARRPSQDWSVCGGAINYISSWSSVVPLYTDVLAPRTPSSTPLKVVLYGGDVTFSVPALGTEIWVDKVGGGDSVPLKFNPFYVDGQVGGYIRTYPNIVFATVRGSGHMVPTYTPKAGLTLFNLFLNGDL